MLFAALIAVAFGAALALPLLAVVPHEAQASSGPTITITDPYVTIELGTTYTDTGATCSGNLPNGETSKTIYHPAGTLTSTGVFTATYSCTDADGNTATANKQITVTATPPTATLNGASPLTYELKSSATDPGVTCRGAFISGGSELLTFDFSTFTRTGTATLTYTCTDSRGVSASVNRVVNVVATPPTIALKGPSAVQLPGPGTLTDWGATCTGAFVTGSPLDIGVGQTYTFSNSGTFGIEFTCSDSRGISSSSVTRTVVVP